MGDKRLISYGVDLGTRVTTAFDSSQAVVREIHFQRGILTTRSAVQETKTYTIKNVDAKAKTLVIEHGQRPGYTLMERKPSETTPNAYRFEVKLAASGTETFPVREERVYDQSLSVTNLTPDVLAVYVQNKSLNEAARRQLDQIAQKKREIAANDAAIASGRSRHHQPHAGSDSHAQQHREPESRQRPAGSGAAVCAPVGGGGNQAGRAARYAKRPAQEESRARQPSSIR